jgi:signal transduction histidine kinase
VSRRLAPASLRFRIAAAFLAATLALLASIGFLIWQYQGVSDIQAVLNDGYLPLARVVDRLQRDQERVDTDVQRLLRDLPRPGTGASSAATIYASEIDENLAIARRRVERVQFLATDAEERAVVHKLDAQLDRIAALYKPYRQLATQVVDLAEANRRAEAQTEAEELIKEGSSLAEEIDKLERQISGRIAVLGNEAEARRVRANVISTVTAGAATLASAALVIAVLYALAPITRLTAEVQQVAAGRSVRPIDVRGSDEVAILATEFNQMVVAIQQRDRRLSERAIELDRLSSYLGSVLDALAEGLVVVESGVVALANPAAKRMFDVRDREPLPPVLADVGAGITPIPTEGGPRYEVRTTPFGASGQILVAADVTERWDASERLARSERLALVGQMLAQVTHEVRNPLNALSLNAELLADELATLDADRKSEAWDLLETVLGEIERLTQVTAHYLQLARRPPAEMAPEDPARVVAEVVRLVEPELHQNGVSIEVKLDPVEPQWYDGGQVRQAILNAVRNAQEADAKRISLKVERRPGSVVISVADDGAGMTEDQVAHATDPFYSTKAKGTGLGLAISRQILEDHGGTVEVRSSPGEGTTVAFVFPAVRPPSGVGAP